MTPENPWIDAVVAGYPADDPRNERRRELLFEASLARGPQRPGTEEGDEAPPELPPPGRWRTLGLRLLLAALAVAICWFLVLSPGAQGRLRGVTTYDQLETSISEPRYSWPLNLIHPLNYDDGWPDWLEDDLRSRVAPRDRLLCFGSTFGRDPLERWEPLWDRNPNDPVYLAERCRLTLPGGSDEDTVARAFEQSATLDPGNGYPHLLVAGALAERAVERDSTKRPARMGGTEWKVRDHGAESRAWRQLGLALESDRIDPHVAELVARRLSRFPAARSFPDLTLNLLSLSTAGAYQGSREGWRSLAGLFAARAGELAASGSRDAMRELCMQWRSCIQRLRNSGPTPHDWLDVHQFVGFSAESMEAASTDLGLAGEASFFAGHSTIETLVKSRFSGITPPPGASRLWPASTRAPAGDPAPGRLAEHRMFESHYLSAAALLLLLVAGLLEVLGATARHRLAGLPGHLATLPGPLDHLRILAVGVVLPLAVILAGLEIPALHPRETTWSSQHAAAVLLKLAALSVAVPYLSSWMIVRSLARRGAPLGFTNATSLPLALCGALALGAGLSACGLFRFLDSSGIPEPEWVWSGFFGLLGLLLLAFLVTFTVFLWHPHRRLQVATGSVLLTRPLILAAALLALMVPVYRKIESNHVAKAEAERIDTPLAKQWFAGESQQQEDFRKAIDDFLATAPR